MRNSISTALANKRLMAVLLLGFASGLPLALTNSTLQAWFTQSHVSIASIGTLTLLGLPYTLKFLWAPLMDQYGFTKLGKRRGWIALTQVGVIITLLLLANMNPENNALGMGVVALFIAFFSASQDIAYDAYRTDILTPAERGLGASYMIFGYRVAILFSGGLALLIADHWGWRITYELMAFFMFISLFITYKSPSPSELPPVSTDLFATIKAAIKDLFQREKIVLLLLFIGLYKIGDALALSLMTNFLIKGLGFSLTEVGLAYKIVSFVATILGAFIGGLMLIRFNLYRALLVFGIAQAFSNLTFAWLAFVGKHFILMSASIFIENFCSGLSTAALLALMMSLCDQKYTAQQFALLSAVASLGRVFLGPLAAVMVANLGWIQFYIWSFILCFPSILLLVLLKEKVLSHAQLAVN